MEKSKKTNINKIKHLTAQGPDVFVQVKSFQWNNLLLEKLNLPPMSITMYCVSGRAMVSSTEASLLPLSATNSLTFCSLQ